MERLRNYETLLAKHGISYGYIDDDLNDGVSRKRDREVRGDNSAALHTDTEDTSSQSSISHSQQVS